MFPNLFNHRSLFRNVIFIVICPVVLAWVIWSSNRGRKSVVVGHRRSWIEPCSFVSGWAGPSALSLSHCLQLCRLWSSSERGSSCHPRNFFRSLASRPCVMHGLVPVLWTPDPVIGFSDLLCSALRFNSWVGKISGEGVGYPLQVQSFFSTFLEFLETSFLQVIDKTILLTYDLVSELLLTWDTLHSSWSISGLSLMMYKGSRSLHSGCWS